MVPPTRLQARTLSAIRRLTKDGVAPSYAELQRELGFASVSNVHRLVSCLKERGWVEFSPGRARTLRIVEDQGGVLQQLHKLSSEELRQLIAHASGIAAHRDGDGGLLIAAALRNISDRLTGQPRRAA